MRPCRSSTHRRSRGSKIRALPAARNRSTAIGPILAASLLLSCGQAIYDVSTERISLPIGDSRVDLVEHRSDVPGLTYVNLHDDENTAVEAALAVIRNRGGIVYELQHGGDRNLTFRLNGSQYTIDPNRVFTDTGVSATLASHGNSNADARAAVRAFSDTLLYHIGFRELAFIITIHNNSENGYSSLSYADGGDLSGDARAVHLSSDEDPDNFYFVTSEQLFNTLQAHSVNVVLQDNIYVLDDGSLSVIAGREGIPYVNTEAQHGEVDVQRGMLERLHGLLATE